MTSVAEAYDQVSAVLAKRDYAAHLSGNYYDFIRAAWHVIEPHTEFKPNWHIQKMCGPLEAMSRGELRYLQYWVPPGSMKSIITSVMLNAWEWTSRPWLRYITGSYADDLSERLSTKTRDIVESEWYQTLWPHVQLKADENKKGEFATTEGGLRLSTSPTGGVTGRHADRIIIDDPIKPMEIVSELQLQKVAEWYDATLSTRAGDPTKVSEIIIMQRLHEQDLAAHVLKYAEWEIVCLPERYDPRHPHLWDQDIRTVEGELLWPDQVDERANALRQLKLGSHYAAGQLQQMPAAREGGLLKRKWWKYFDPDLIHQPLKLELQRIVTSWDTTFKEKTSSDYVVGQVWGVRGADRFLIRSLRERMDFGATKRAIKEFDVWIRTTWPYLPVTHVIEKSANGVKIIEQLNREVPGIHPWVADVDKYLRAEAAQPVLEAGNCFVPGVPNPQRDSYDPSGTPAWVQEFIEECVKFNRGANDDQVDAWSQGMGYITSLTPYEAEIWVPEGDI